MNFKNAIGKSHALEGRARIIARLLEEVHGDVAQTERLLAAVAARHVRCLQLKLKEKMKALAAAQITLGNRGLEPILSEADKTAALSKQLRDESVGTYWVEMDARVGEATEEHFRRGWHQGTAPLLSMDEELPRFEEAVPHTVAAMHGMSASARHQRRILKRKRNDDNDDDYEDAAADDADADAAVHDDDDDDDADLVAIRAKKLHCFHDAAALRRRADDHVDR